MKLKNTPEDFLVREHWKPTFSAGSYSVYLLRKRDWNTEDCLQWLADKLQKQRKDFGCCGNKDKQAVTEQYITIKQGPQQISTPPDFVVTFLGYRNAPLRMGEHERNWFIITANEVQKATNTKIVKNYFGEQRFGQNNLEIGLALLRKEYKRAVEMLGLPESNDPIRTIRSVPKHTLLLYVHSVQSQLWNELVGSLQTNVNEVPIVGFGPSGDLSLLSRYESLMQRYGLSQDSWINRSVPELSLEGGSRLMLQDLQSLSISEIKNSTCTACFSLGKGSYATETMKQIVE